ncbi:hypothetical protein [Streptomyces halobius]|uniref:Uncharacterized protein n=1 Tax=Streptomyces halobius TaxID=2879846 RepID=A0ABY4M1U9_9ACTN|nr:hypothetical protein [Streptomyces halobius]UQA91658.1 hypothetical protein K9S39_07085 [Streptomyces halobius]
MNPLELRYALYVFLSGLSQPAAIKWAVLISPEPGEPVAIEVGVDDEYSTPPMVRKYRIIIEEVANS